MMLPSGRGKRLCRRGVNDQIASSTDRWSGIRSTLPTRHRCRGTNCQVWKISDSVRPDNAPDSAHGLDDQAVEPPSGLADRLINDPRGIGRCRASRVGAAGAPSWRAVVAVRAEGSASEPPTNRRGHDPAPSGGWGARASRARSELRRQASHAGAPAAPTRDARHLPNPRSVVRVGRQLPARP
jgi:hypothetical protein